MKFLFGLFLVLTVLTDGLKKASRINNAVAEARTYYQQGHFKQAASLYEFLADSLHVTDVQLKLNLAHADFQTGDLTGARKIYSALLDNKDLEIQSVALNQLGLIFFEKNNPEKALYHFKKALIQNPLNETARYNYELLKKYLAANPPPSDVVNKKQDQPQNQPSGRNKASAGGARPAEEGKEGTTPDYNTPGNNTATNKPNSSTDGKQNESINKTPDLLAGNNQPEKINQGNKGNSDKGIVEEPEEGNGMPNRPKAGTENANEQDKELQTLKARLRNSNLTAEKAKMLLEAMHQAEIQYLQQLPRKPTRSNKPTGPDW
jgi:tetratricopeptide (TPR) repeat protein